MIIDPALRNKPYILTPRGKVNLVNSDNVTESVKRAFYSRNNISSCLESVVFSCFDPNFRHFASLQLTRNDLDG